MTHSEKDFIHALGFLCRIFGHNYNKYHATEDEKKAGHATFICGRCGHKLVSKITPHPDGTYEMDPNPTDIF